MIRVAERNSHLGVFSDQEILHTPYKHRFLRRGYWGYSEDAVERERYICTTWSKISENAFLCNMPSQLLQGSCPYPRPLDQRLPAPESITFFFFSIWPLSNYLLLSLAHHPCPEPHPPVLTIFPFSIAKVCHWGCQEKGTTHTCPLNTRAGKSYK